MILLMVLAATILFMAIIIWFSEKALARSRERRLAIDDEQSSRRSACGHSDSTRGRDAAEKSFELEHKIDGRWVGSYRGARFSLTDTDNTDWHAHHAGGSEGPYGTMQEAINALERKVDVDLAEQEKRLAEQEKRIARFDSDLNILIVTVTIFRLVFALLFLCGAYSAATTHNILGALLCSASAAFMVLLIWKNSD